MNIPGTYQTRILLFFNPRLSFLQLERFFRTNIGEGSTAIQPSGGGIEAQNKGNFVAAHHHHHRRQHRHQPGQKHRLGHIDSDNYTRCSNHTPRSPQVFIKIFIRFMIALTLSTVNLTAKSKGSKYIFSRSVTSLSLSELDSPQKLWTT